MKNNWFFLYDLTWRPNLCSGNYQNKDSHTMNKIMVCYLIINISNVEKITRKDKMRTISSHLILYFRIYTLKKITWWLHPAELMRVSLIICDPGIKDLVLWDRDQHYIVGFWLRLANVGRGKESERGWNLLAGFCDRALPFRWGLPLFFLLSYSHSTPVLLGCCHCLWIQRFQNKNPNDLNCFKRFILWEVLLILCGKG